MGAFWQSALLIAVLSKEKLKWHRRKELTPLSQPRNRLGWSDGCPLRYKSAPAPGALMKHLSLAQSDYALFGNLLFMYAGFRGLSAHYGLAAKKLDRVFYDQGAAYFNETWLLKTFKQHYHFEGESLEPHFESNFYGNFIARAANMEVSYGSRVPVYVLTEYMQSWKYFCNIDRVIQAEYLHILQKFGGKNRLTQALAEIDSAGVRPTVGVHIRLGDKIFKEYETECAPTEDYLQQAFEWYRKKLKDPIFVVFCGKGNTMNVLYGTNSADREAKICKSIIPSVGTVVHAVGGTGEEDMSTLASCDHSIMTIGTYGWMASFLSGGHVVSMRNQVRGWKAESKSINREDFFPKSWKLIDNDCSLSALKATLMKAEVAYDFVQDRYSKEDTGWRA